MGVIESASRLFDLLSSKDDTFTKYLRPGLSHAEIECIVAPTGVRLPDEAVAFYEHFSLPLHFRHREEALSFYGGYWLLGLEEAVEQFKVISGVVARYFPETDHPDSSRWFPFLQANNDFYLQDTASTEGGGGPIIQLVVGLEPEVAFVSLEAMFDTLHAWVQEGVLGVESGGVVGCYEGDPVRVSQIAARMNPGVKRWTKH